jgi:hypothetical protein
MATPTDVLARLREATYDVPDGSKVQYSSGGDVYRDACDLYAILDEVAPSGSSNLENDIVRQLLTDLRQGKAPNGQQWGALRALLEKYARELAALRASPDKGGQDFVGGAAPGTGRVIPAPSSSGRDAQGRSR